MIKAVGLNFTLGQTVYCKLTGKPLIVQKLHYKTGVNPQYVAEERELERLTVRYM